MRVCLLETDTLSAPFAPLPFGEAEQSRLSAIGRVDRAKESYGALLALSKLVGKDPPFIRRTENGKPYFEGKFAPSFSLCHGGGLAAALLNDTSSAQVGIDLEKLRSYPQAKRVAARFFTQEELLRFSAMGESEDAFFLLWTQKEALAKMTGVGIARSLGKELPKTYFRSFHVSSGEISYMLTVCSEKEGSSLSWVLPKGYAYEEIDETEM